MNKIVFKGFKVAESYFKLNEVAKENEKYTIAPRFECRLASSGSEFEADFSVSIAAVTEDMPVPFDLRVVLQGKFSAENSVAPDKTEQLRYAVGTLFPFLRSHVATLTANCSVPAFVLPEIDIDAMISSSARTVQTPTPKEQLN